MKWKRICFAFNMIKYNNSHTLSSTTYLPTCPPNSLSLPRVCRLIGGLDGWMDGYSVDRSAPFAKWDIAWSGRLLASVSKQRESIK